MESQAQVRTAGMRQSLSEAQYHHHHHHHHHHHYHHYSVVTVRVVKTGTGKSVNRFPTGNRFSERITGYRIHGTSCQHDPGNADGGV